MDNNVEEISYLLLQNEYLKIMGVNNFSETEILKEFNKFFPENWMIDYDTSEKIKLLSRAIKEKNNIINIIENDEKIL